MQLNFLQEDLLAAMQLAPVATPATVLQRKPAKPTKPVQISLLADEPPPTKTKLQAPIENNEEKAPSAFKTISEAAEILAVPAHVLRFWESQFAQISPTKSRGGRRYYRPEDMQILSTIKHLLYKQGYTIKGARKALSQVKDSVSQGAVPVVAKPARAFLSDKQKAQLASIRSELLGFREQLVPYLA